MGKNMKKIAVLGGGNGGHVMAADLALRGYNVYFWGRNPGRLATVFTTKRIKVIGSLEGQAKLSGASADIGEAVKGAEMVIIPLPAYAHRDVSERCAQYLEDGQVVVFCAQSGMGSFVLAKTLRELGIKKDILCAEHVLPYGARLVEPGVVHSRRLPTDLHVMYPRGVGVFPARRTQEVMPFINEIYPGWPAVENSLASALISRGPGMHPAIMVLGASLMENFLWIDTHGEGTTSSVRKVVYELDKERKAVEGAWGYQVMEAFAPGYFTGEQTIRSDFYGRDAKSQEVKLMLKERLWMGHRYITEDVAYGLVLRSSAAKKCGIEVPVSDALVRLASVINGEDYYSKGMSLENLGLGAMTVDQINNLLYEGWG